MQHIKNYAVLTQRICSSFCLDIMELINISKVAQLKIISNTDSLIVPLVYLLIWLVFEMLGQGYMGIVIAVVLGNS
jgi:hypothetical protein